MRTKLSQFSRSAIIEAADEVAARNEPVTEEAVLEIMQWWDELEAEYEEALEAHANGTLEAAVVSLSSSAAQQALLELDDTTDDSVDIQEHLRRLIERK